MKQILKQLHLYFYHFMVVLFYFLLYPWLFGYSRNQRSYHKLNKIRKWNAQLACFFSGIRYIYHFKEKIDWSKTYIVCANHSSNIDIMAMNILMENSFFYMGKDELLNNPLTSLYFKTIDVPVNRQSKISSYKAFKKAEERLKEGISLIIFPEGKIGDEYPPLLHPFKNGPFKLAISLGLPILPVSIVNNWEILWDDGKRYGSKPGKCQVIVHAPVYTENLSEKDEENLKNNVFEIVHSALNYKVYTDSLVYSDEN